MKKSLQLLTNKLHEDVKYQLFGEGSKIVINSVKYLTTNKHYHIIVTLEPTDYQSTQEAYPLGVEYLVEEAWKFFGKDDILIITTSLKT